MRLLDPLRECSHHLSASRTASQAVAVQARSLYAQSTTTPRDTVETVAVAELQQQGRAGRPNEFAFVGYDPADARPERDWAATLQRAIRFAEWPVDDRLDGTQAFGLAAYDAWAATVSAGLGEAPVQATVDMTAFFASRIADQRRCAAEVLTQDATLCPGFAQAAEHYRAAADSLGRIAASLVPAGPATGEAMEAGLLDPAIRDRATGLILQARDEEAQTVAALKAALRDLTTTEPVAQEDGAVGRREEAERRCERAQELKTQGRNAEAAEQLVAAIALDPGYAEAYWVLALVRLNLHDPARAPDAFRKVIETAPASGRATQAQQALARLGQ